MEKRPSLSFINEEPGFAAAMSRVKAHGKITLTSLKLKGVAMARSATEGCGDFIDGRMSRVFFFFPWRMQSLPVR